MFIDFREKGGEREENIDVRNIDQPPPIHALTKKRTHNAGMCPDQKSNPQPSDAQQDAPTTPARAFLNFF